MQGGICKLPGPWVRARAGVKLDSAIGEWQGPDCVGLRDFGMESVLF